MLIRDGGAIINFHRLIERSDPCLTPARPHSSQAERASPIVRHARLLVPVRAHLDALAAALGTLPNYFSPASSDDCSIKSLPLCLFTCWANLHDLACALALPLRLAS
jgi:hypothetical protein